MRQYLLDTNICIYLLKNKYGVAQHLIDADIMNCHISEITYAELLYGAESCANPEKEKIAIKILTSRISIVPIFKAIPLYAKEKVRLKKEGRVIGDENKSGDFDILIGTTAVANGMVMVTENVKHFSRLKNIEIENWSDRNQEK